MKYSLVIAIISIVLCGCKSTEKEPQATYVVKINPDDSKFIGFKDWCAGIELIPLETVDESLIKSCDKIIFQNDRFYVYDGSQGNVFAFDRTGKFLFGTKHLQGQGPDEFLAMTDFNVNPITSNLEMVDAMRLRIRIYDSDFNYFEEVKLTRDLYPMHLFWPLNDDIYLFYASSIDKDTGESDGIKFFSTKKQQIISQTGKHKCPQWFSRYTPVEQFYYLNSDVFFCYDFTDNYIYRINQETMELEEHFFIDFGKKNFSYEMLPQNENDEFYMFYKIRNDKERFAYIGNKLENRRYFSVFFHYADKLHLVLYDKTNGKIILGHNYTESSDFLQPHILTDEAMYSIPHLLEYIPYYIDKELLDEKSKQVLVNILEDDNPVIIKYVLKHP